jgi:hypothetical protein
VGVGSTKKNIWFVRGERTQERKIIIEHMEKRGINWITQTTHTDRTKTPCGIPAFQWPESLIDTEAI